MDKEIGMSINNATIKTEKPSPVPPAPLPRRLSRIITLLKIMNKRKLNATAEKIDSCSTSNLSKKI